MNEPASDKSPPTPPVAIVLVNWNNWRDCIECIDSVLRLQYPNFHVFVVDNDSGDQSVDNIANWCRRPVTESVWKILPGVDRWSDQPGQLCSDPLPCRVSNANKAPLQKAPSGCHVTVIRSGGNLGFAGGCNVGIECASTNTYDYFWFLNTDTVVHRDALTQLVGRARADQRIGMVGSTVLYYDAPDTVQAMAGAKLQPASGDSRHIGEGRALQDVPSDPAAIERELTYIFGASMLVSSQLIREVGLMQEDYFLYYEEMDWAMRSRDTFKFAYAPHSLVYHKSGNSSSKAMPLFTANLYYRNRIRFMSRFFPQALSATKRTLVSTLARSIAKGQWAQVRLLLSIILNANHIAAGALRQPHPTAPTK